MTAKLGLGGYLKALTREPVLLWEAVRTAFGMRRRGGLTPSAAYLGWRTHTAYGNEKAGISPSDLVHYLRWRREMRIISRWGRVT